MHELMTVRKIYIILKSFRCGVLLCRFVAELNCHVMLQQTLALHNIYTNESTTEQSDAGLVITSNQEHMTESSTCNLKPVLKL